MRLFVKFLQKYEFSFRNPKENSKILNYFMFFRESHSFSFHQVLYVTSSIENPTANFDRYQVFLFLP